MASRALYWVSRVSLRGETWQLLANINEPGIWCDVLHISDLQLVPDMIASSLIELSGLRENGLASLWDNYIQWCTDNSAFRTTFCFASVCAEAFPMLAEHSGVYSLQRC